jgi:putative MATE family efflux protein
MFSFNWFSGVLRGLGDSKTPFMLLIISIVLNIILAPVLITGAFGLFPKLGIAGSALATVISQLLTTVYAFIYLAKKNVLLNIFKWNYKFDFAIIKKMFAIGVPVSLQMMINALSAVIIVSFVNRFGPSVIAAFGIGMRIDQFSFMPAMSLGSSVTAMVSQHIGAGKQEKIPEIMFNAMLLSLGFALFFFIPVNLFPHQIASIFTSGAPVGAELGTYFRLDSPTYFAYAAMFAIQGVIRGAGDTIPLTIISLITLLIFRAGIVWGLVSFTHLNQSGIWAGMVISIYVGTILSYLYYKYGNWKQKNLAQLEKKEALSGAEVK